MDAMLGVRCCKRILAMLTGYLLHITIFSLISPIRAFRVYNRVYNIALRSNAVRGLPSQPSLRHETGRIGLGVVGLFKSRDAFSRSFMMSRSSEIDDDLRSQVTSEIDDSLRSQVTSNNNNNNNKYNDDKTSSSSGSSRDSSINTTDSSSSSSSSSNIKSIGYKGSEQYIDKSSNSSNSSSMISNRGTKSIPTIDPYSERKLLFRSANVITIIKAVIDGRKSIDSSDIFIEELGIMRGKDVAEAMFLSVKIWKKKRNVNFIKRHLKAIVDRLAQFPADGWRAKDIAHIIFSLQAVRNDDVGAIEILPILNEIVKKSLKGKRMKKMILPSNEKSEKNGSDQSNKNEYEKSHEKEGTEIDDKIDSGIQVQVLSARDVSMILYGLQGFQSEDADVRTLFDSLADAIRASTGQFDVLCVGQSLYALQRMNSIHPEVRKVLSALTEKIMTVEGSLDSQGIGNALYGLQRMSSDHLVVRILLSVLTVKVQNCTYVPTGQEVMNMIYGLRGMKSDHKEVRELLKVLIPLVNRCSQNLNGQAVSCLLLGMNGMNNDDIEVRNMMRSIYTSISRGNADMTASGFGAAMFGLQGMSSNQPEILSIIGLLSKKLKESNEVFQISDLAGALYGLQRMSSEHVEVRTLLSILNEKIKKCRAHPLSIDQKNRRYVMIKGKETISKNDLPKIRHDAMCNALYGMQNMNTDYSEVRDILYTLSPLLNACTEPFTSKGLSNAMFSLQGMSIESRELRRVLYHLLPKFKHLTTEFTSQEIGNFFYGMQRMTSGHSLVREAVVLMTKKIENCREEFTAKSLGYTMIGLQGLSSHHAGTSDLLMVLIPKLQSCTDTFTAHDISNILYGLRDMSSTCPAVRTVLLVFVLKIKSCNELFTPALVSKCLYGLQGMNYDSFEVRTLLFALVPKIKNCVGEYSLHEIGLALYGLQGVWGKIEGYSLSEYFYSQLFMLGGQGEGGGGGGVRGGGDRMENTIDINGDYTDNKNDGINDVDYNKMEIDNTRNLINKLNFQSSSTEDIISLTKHLIILKESLDAVQEDKSKKWSYVSDVLVNEISRRKTAKDLYFENNNVSSDFHSEISGNDYLTESRINTESSPELGISKNGKDNESKDEEEEENELKIILKLAENVFEKYANDSVRIYSNVFIENIFESDIILRVSVENKKEIKIMKNTKIPDKKKSDLSNSEKNDQNYSNSDKSFFYINIEIDGVVDKPEKKQKFSFLRDQYLKSRGLYIVRVDVSDLNKVDEKEKGEWLINMVDHFSRRYQTEK